MDIILSSAFLRLNQLSNFKYFNRFFYFNGTIIPFRICEQLIETTRTGFLRTEWRCVFGESEEHKDRFLSDRMVVFLCLKQKRNMSKRSSLPRVGRVARSAGRVEKLFVSKPHYSTPQSLRDSSPASREQLFLETKEHKDIKFCVSK